MCERGPYLTSVRFASSCVVRDWRPQAEADLGEPVAALDASGHDSAEPSALNTQPERPPPAGVDPHQPPDIEDEAY